MVLALELGQVLAVQSHLMFLLVSGLVYVMMGVVQGVHSHLAQYDTFLLDNPPKHPGV